MELLTRRLPDATKGTGLWINLEKTNYLFISRCPETQRNVILQKGSSIQLPWFIPNSNSGIKTEIDNRIQTKPNQCYYCIVNILKSNQ